MNLLNNVNAAFKTAQRQRARVQGAVSQRLKPILLVSVTAELKALQKSRSQRLAEEAAATSADWPPPGTHGLMNLWHVPLAGPAPGLSQTFGQGAFAAARTLAYRASTLQQQHKTIHMVICWATAAIRKDETVPC